MINKIKYPKEINFRVALEYAKEACGTNVIAFPNWSTMNAVWNIHAEKIMEAMQYAYIMSTKWGRSTGNICLLEIKPDPIDKIVNGCGECDGIIYHHPNCDEL